MQKPLKDWQMALVILGITAVGVLIPVLGWAIPILQAVPSLRPDDERPPQQNVRTHIISLIEYACILQRYRVNDTCRGYRRSVFFLLDCRNKAS